MVLEALTTLELNELDRRVTAAERRRDDTVTMPAAQARQLLEGYSAPAAEAGRTDKGGKSLRERLKRTQRAIQNIEAEIVGLGSAEREIEEALKLIGE